MDANPLGVEGTPPITGDCISLVGTGCVCSRVVHIVCVFMCNELPNVSICDMSLLLLCLLSRFHEIIARGKIGGRYAQVLAHPLCRTIVRARKHTVITSLALLGRLVFSGVINRVPAFWLAF